MAETTKIELTEATLPDGWSDRTDSGSPDLWAIALQGEDTHGPMAWINEHGVFGLDENDRDFDPPVEVRAWLEAQAAKRVEPPEANDPGRDQSWRGALAGLADARCTVCTGSGLLPSGDPCSCLADVEPGEDIVW